MCLRHYDGAMDDALKIQSITGVDVEIRIAGPGGRSYAFVVDWHIRLLLALTWFILGTVLLTGGLTFADDLDNATSTGFVFAVVLPATALFFLYHPVLEIVMQGRTPGKRIAGIRIVTLSGDVPGVGAILIRNILRLVDSLPGVYAVGLAATVLTPRSVRIGDMAAGTLLVYEEDTRQDVFSQVNSDAIAKVGLENLQLIRELIERWPELEVDVRIELGRNMLRRFEGDVPGRIPDHEENVLDALRSLVDER